MCEYVVIYRFTGLTAELNRVNTCMYIYVHVCIYIHVWIYVCTKHMCIYIYMYIYI